MFLYIRQETGKKAFLALDLLHFLPALVYLVDFWPIFSLPVDQKISLIKSEISYHAVYPVQPIAFFSCKFLYPFPLPVVDCLLVAFVYDYVRVGSKNPLNRDFAKEWFVWIKIFLVLESMVFLPALLLYWAITPLTAYYLAHLSNIILNVGTGLSPPLFPKSFMG